MTRLRPKLGTIAIAVYFLATPAAAAEFTRTRQPNGDVITIRGKIEDGDHWKFIEITRDIKQASVILNSNGGRIGQAIHIGRLVRDRNYETRVHNGAICNSACTLIWLSGTFRHLDSRARLGFHSARKQLKPPYERSDQGNAIQAAYMASIGVPQKVIDLQPKADPCCLNYIDHAQAKAWGLLSDRPATQQALSTPSTQRPAWPTPTTQQPFPPGWPATQQQALSPGTQQPAAAREAALAGPEKAQERIEPRRQQFATTPGQHTAPVAQKVVLYEEDPSDPNGKRFVGSAIWRTETVTAGPAQQPDLAIRADVEVPERKLAMTWLLRRNTDKGLPATHTVEIMFRLPADFPSGGITNVPGILMKQAEQTRGVPLAGSAVKVTNGLYLIGLSNLDTDKERNVQLLKERAWFDIPVVYSNNRRAILAMEKGASGERVFADAFAAWERIQPGTQRQALPTPATKRDAAPTPVTQQIIRHGTVTNEFVAKIGEYVAMTPDPLTKKIGPLSVMVVDNMATIASVFKYDQKLISKTGVAFAKRGDPSAIIFIEPGMSKLSPEAQRRAVVHEMMHVLDYSLGVSSTKDFTMAYYLDLEEMRAHIQEKKSEVIRYHHYLMSATRVREAFAETAARLMLPPSDERDREGFEKMFSNVTKHVREVLSKEGIIGTALPAQSQP